MKTKDSSLAHQLLGSLAGVEIQSISSSPLHLLECAYVDHTHNFPDESFDYVASCHVIERLFDPVITIKEWLRVVKPGGYVFIISQRKDTDPEARHPSTQLEELICRNEGDISREEVLTEAYQNSRTGILSSWDLNDFLPLCWYYKWPVHTALATDDMTGEGFCVVIQKQ